MLLPCTSASSQDLSLSWEWAKQVNGNSGSNDLVVDHAGNSYVTGYFKGTADFGGNALTANTAWEGFVAKYNKEGQEQWAVNIGGQGKKIAVDAFGNTYITGSFKGQSSFGEFQLESTGSFGFFIVKVDPLGKIAWAKGASTMTYDYSSDVGVDGQGNSYVTGQFEGTVDFGGFSLTSQYIDIFLIKYDPQGNVVWARKAGGAEFERAGNLAVEANGNVYVTGNFSGTAHFGSFSFYNLIGGISLFLAKFDPDGNVIWAKAAEGSASSRAVVLDKMGNVIIAGSKGTTHMFDQYALEAGFDDIFFVKYTSAGSVQWAKAVGGASDYTVEAWDLAVDYKNNIYMVGEFGVYSTRDYSVSVRFDHLTMANYSGSSSYVTKFTSEGSAIWVKQIGGKGYASKKGVGTDGQGNCYLTGIFNYSPNFGTTQLNFTNWGIDATDTFVAKLGASADVVLLPISLSNYMLCAGASLPVAFTAYGSIAADATYSIQLSDENGSFNNPVTIGESKNSPVASIIPSGSKPGDKYKIRVVLNAPTPVIREVSSHLQINALPGIPQVTPSAVCGAGTVTLQATGASGDQSYAWYNVPDGGAPLLVSKSSSFTTPALTSTTKFFVALRSGAGCENARVAAAAVIDSGISANSGPYQEVCISAGSIMLQDFSPVGGRWFGRGVSIEGIFNPEKAGVGEHVLTYALETSPCYSTSSKKIKVNPSPVLDAGFEPSLCGSATQPVGYAPFTIQFKNLTKEGTTYLWDFGDGTFSKEAVPLHTYTAKGTYAVYLTVSSSGGCTVKEKVATAQVNEQKQISNIFTPNEDGINDYFVLDFSCLPVALKVFNRWGKMVFEEKSYQNNWRAHGLAEGVYFYNVEATDGQKWKGWVEIVR
ncbi:hypothetical protein TH61_15880 [Rufibacter sp. DG15C]|nr:hypothetical protein TH61_15880 [Rufibacter sp. DG15C]